MLYIVPEVGQYQADADNIGPTPDHFRSIVIVWESGTQKTRQLNIIRISWKIFTITIPIRRKLGFALI